MIAKVKVSCDCFRAAPWPVMHVLDVARGTRRYYVCPRCGTIREDFCRPDGTVAITHFHHLECASLPTPVVERASGVLAQPSYRQLPLF